MIGSTSRGHKMKKLYKFLVDFFNQELIDMDRCDKEIIHTDMPEELHSGYQYIIH